MTTASLPKFLAAALVLAASTVAGCNRDDPYATKFQEVAVGDSRTRVVETLGPPRSVNSFEIPFVKLEHLTYRPPNGNQRVYVVILAQDRVASKSILD